MPVFHQIEGLVIDRGITFGDLAGTLEAFTTAYFGGELHVPLRPSYFPFTEPSAEFDIAAARRLAGSSSAAAAWCTRTCCRRRPRPRGVVGFAFGFGIDRLALMRHGVDDLREFFTNDVRFLSQF